MYYYYLICMKYIWAWKMPTLRGIKSNFIYNFRTSQKRELILISLTDKFKWT